MKPLSPLCFVLCFALSAPAAFGRGMGSHMAMAGTLGTSAATPGTNSSGTALPSSGASGHARKGPLLGTNPAIDQEDARLKKILEGSICRGC